MNVECLQSISSWNSSIARFIKHGNFMEALCYFEQMQNSRACPNAVTFSSILKASGSLRDIHKGREIYIDILKRGLLEKDTIIGSALIYMYFESGSPTEAHETFSRLAVRDAGLWNALISGYVKEGRDLMVLNCLDEMLLEGVPPDAITFTCELKACSRISDSENGVRLHVSITKMGLLEKDLVLGSALVDMYAKCGFLTDSLVVFEKLPEKDVGLWNSLIAGHVALEHYENACFFVQQMQQEGVTPDNITYTIILKATGNIGAVRSTKEIQSVMERNGSLERHEFMSNVLVDAYAKNGFLTEAQELFDRLPVQNLASWTALMSGYIEHECGEEALSCFEHMQLQGIHPDTLAYACSLKGCGIIGALEKGMEIHADIKRTELGEDPNIGNALICMYMRCGCITGAQDAFDNLPLHNMYTWTSLVSGYTEHGHYVEALMCFRRMQLQGVTPDGSTFACSLKACSCCLNGIRVGREIHAKIEMGALLEEDVGVGNALVNMYVRWGEFRQAHRILDHLRNHNSDLWNALITGYMKHGRAEEVLDIFEQMQGKGVYPSAITFTCTLVACGSTGAIEKGKSIHAELERRQAKDHFINNALVAMYCKCGSLANAHDVFETLLIRDDFAWDAVMSGSALLGKTQDVLCLFEMMMSVDGCKPSDISFLSVLHACSHAGMVCEAETMYSSLMMKQFGLIPTAEHYTCLIDLFARAGQLPGAFTAIKRLPFQPDIVAWSTLLAACRKWGDVERAKDAFRHAMQVNDEENGAYACMYNICKENDHLYLY